MAEIEITSIVSLRDKQPYVQVKVTDSNGTAKIQVKPEDAQEQAMILQHAAESALSDAFMLEFLRNVLHAEEPALAGVLKEFREYREKREWKPPTTKVMQ